MGNKEVSPAVIIAIVAVVIVLVGIIGWKALSPKQATRDAAVQAPVYPGGAPGPGGGGAPGPGRGGYPGGGGYPGRGGR